VTVEATALLAELERVLASAEFRGSERRARLLRYLVEKAIAGEPVKEYIIGVDVFDKSPDYDPRIDPIVRVEMGRVRTKLADYYAGEGKSNRERLEFPKRSYTPTLVAAEPAGNLASKPRPGVRAAIRIGGVSVIVAIVGGAIAWRLAVRANLPHENPQAREQCAKARFFWNKRTPESLRTSLELYQEVIRKSPTYAPAYAGEALCYAVMATDSQLPADPASSQARDAANAAIALDPNVAEAHAALGLIAWAVQSDFNRAEAELGRAISLDPNFASARQWRALSLTYIGHTDEARIEIQKALALDPVSMPLLAADGMISYYSRNYQDTIDKGRRMLEMDPAFREAHIMLGQALEAQHDWTGAEKEFQTVDLASSGDSEGSARLAHVYALTGRSARARDILDKLLKPSADQFVDPYQLTFVFTALGEKEMALEWLEKAVRQHTAIIMKVDPYLDPLRGEPEFQRLLAEAHLN
jgi:tetratricopeptide (TPR) repeat protein